jgi:Uma2 family endonuclease
MASVTQRLITAEEFWLIPPPPDGTKVELVKGEVIPVCRPGFQHGLSQGRTFAVLDHYGRSNHHGRAVVETGVITARDPDSVRGPDVSYWSFERLPLELVPQGYPELAPDVSAEVLSPNNRMAKIRQKMQEYFQRGVRMVWVVDPEDRTVTVYRSMDEGRLLHENATLTCEDVLPGFSCRVADLLP